MVKQQKGMTDNETIILVIAFILLFAFICFNGYRILKLEEQIDSLPHWECHNEIDSIKIELKPLEQYPIGDNDFTCEKGYIYLNRMIRNYAWDKTIVCLIEETKEVCEIV